MKVTTERKGLQNDRQRRATEIFRIEENKSKDFAIEGWSLLSIDIGDSGDVDSSSLGESGFLRSKCGVLLLKEVKKSGNRQCLDSLIEER